MLCLAHKGNKIFRYVIKFYLFTSGRGERGPGELHLLFMKRVI